MSIYQQPVLEDPSHYTDVAQLRQVKLQHLKPKETGKIRTPSDLYILS